MSSDTPLVVKCLTAGAAACFAESVTFPMDKAKVRLQVEGEGAAIADKPKQKLPYRGLTRTILKIVREEGIRSLYSGLAAGLQRQICFCSIRIGLYEPVRNFYQPIFDGPGAQGLPSIKTRILAGLTTGSCAVLAAQPTEVVRVRFQTAVIDRKNPHIRRYSSTFQAYKIIATEDGLKGLWKGFYANILRTSIVNVAEAVVYDIVKSSVLRRQLMEDAVPLHATAATAAGFTATLVASPVDVVKTRYMNADTGLYRNALHCALTLIRKEGPTAFYKGYIPFFCRVVSWNIVMWLTFEELKKLI